MLANRWECWSSGSCSTETGQSKPESTGGRGCGSDTVGQEGWQEEVGMWPLQRQQHKGEAAGWTPRIIHAWLDSGNSTEFEETKLLEVPNDWGHRLTGRKISVIADIEIPPAGTEWPPGTISAIPCLQALSPRLWYPILFPGVFMQTFFRGSVPWTLCGVDWDRRVDRRQTACRKWERTLWLYSLLNSRN